MMTHLLLIPVLLTAAPEATRLQWDIDGLHREAFVSTPVRRDLAPAPVVFVFHGHGGKARGAARSFHIHDLWPEAIVVYPQGVPTPGKLTDPDGKRNGWQHNVGEQDDRDLKFFDAMVQTLRKEHNIDETRIYSTGHSNGGGFTYLLWAARPDVFAAVAPSSAAAGKKWRQLKPLPAMHIAGESDPLVKYVWQEWTMAAVRNINGCADEGTKWAKHATLYPSDTGTPFVTVIHSGGHKFLADAPPLIVKFFKEHAKSRKSVSREKDIAESAAAQ